jgi:hypothetical protein
MKPISRSHGSIKQRIDDAWKKCIATLNETKKKHK